MKPARVNLGCGNRIHPDWINIDIEPAPGVIRHDLARGIPLPDGSCAVVYHSHVLEHIRKDEALRLMGECFRVLEPGGILRVATPDLERICAAYLERLAAHRRGDASASADLDWIRIELVDQMTRERPGGEMGPYLLDPPNPGFVEARVGRAARELQSIGPASGLLARIHRAGLRTAFRVAASRAITALRRTIVLLAAGPRGVRAYDIGRFRLAGEVHQWLYDEQSLGALMTEAGFVDPIRHSAHTSAIPDWPRFRLDVDADGAVIKPDSIFMEARRP